MRVHDMHECWFYGVERGVINGAKSNKVKLTKALKFHGKTMTLSKTSLAKFTPRSHNYRKIFFFIKARETKIFKINRSIFG